MDFESSKFSQEKKEAISRESEKRYATSIENLPPLPVGYLRLVHIIVPEHIEGILKSGLNYCGDISSTAVAYSKESEVEYSTTDPRFNIKGMKVVVIDMPAAEHRIHYDIAKAPGFIPPKYIVGVVDVQIVERTLKNQEK